MCERNGMGGEKKWKWKCNGKTLWCETLSERILFLFLLFVYFRYTYTWYGFFFIATYFLCGKEISRFFYCINFDDVKLHQKVQHML